MLKKERLLASLFFVLKSTHHMSVIKLLEQNLINQIAAGEVIERPVSAVKELVENALDAGATRITIETEQGGRSLLRISDNGCGILSDDLKLAVQRHATSKIKSQEDLFRIATLGFRGEALPSIASVSKLRISSKHASSKEPFGYVLSMDASTPREIEKTPHDQGTTVEVRDLFYNIPARLKFLKKDETELGHIREYLSRVILARPDVSFTYINDGKTIFKTQGISDNYELALKNAIGVIFGGEVAKQLRAVDLQTADISISGYVSAPTLLTGTRTGQVIFVNNRNIVSPILNKAIDMAVSDIIPKGQYPYAIIFIDIDYSLVDVNVHPAKKEVRFADSGKVFDAVKSAIKNTYAPVVLDFKNMVSASPIVEQRITFSPGRLDLKQQDKIELTAVIADHDKAEIKDTDALPVQQFMTTGKSTWQVIGQAYKTYIILLDGEDLLLIDQHAAQERILYEQLKKIDGGQKNTQALLIPQNIELGLKTLSRMNEFKPVLADLGFEWDEFSATSIVLRTVPVLSTKSSLSEVFKQLIAELQNSGQGLSFAQLKEKILATVACKAAVKAGDVLDLLEMRQLVRDLFNTPFYQTCPHGRPTISVFSVAEIGKRFKRN